MLTIFRFIDNSCAQIVFFHGGGSGTAYCLTYVGGRVKKFAYCLISVAGRVAGPEAVDCYMSDPDEYFHSFGTHGRNSFPEGLQLKKLWF